MKYISIFSLIALLIGGFVYHYLFSGSSDVLEQTAIDATDNYTEELSVSDGIPELETGVATLDALRLRGQNLECEINYDTEEVETKAEGTYFVSDGDMRGDFLTDSPDFSEKILSSIVLTKDMMYTWSEIDGEIYGIKMSTALMGGEQNGVNKSIELDVDVDYRCKEWKNVDRSVFIPPADVLFLDMDSYMPTDMEYGTSYEGEGD